MGRDREFGRAARRRFGRRRVRLRDGLDGCVGDGRGRIGLGDGLGETGRLSPEGRKRAMSALHRFQALADRLFET